MLLRVSAYRLYVDHGEAGVCLRLVVDACKDDRQERTVAALGSHGSSRYRPRRSSTVKVLELHQLPVDTSASHCWAPTGSPRRTPQRGVVALRTHGPASTYEPGLGVGVAVSSPSGLQTRSVVAEKPGVLPGINTPRRSPSKCRTTRVASCYCLLLAMTGYRIRMIHSSAACFAVHETRERDCCS
jgi:hypothetical protein